MGEEKPPEFYDGVKYMKPHIFERYSVIYNRAADYLPRVAHCPLIVDLGCGVGHFAKIINDRGYKRYIGIDFSEQMIEKATSNIQAANCLFLKGNLLDEKTHQLYNDPKEKLFVLLEVLEHIKQDRLILSSIPKNSKVILSLPNFNAKSHVRSFKSAEAIMTRYKNQLRLITYTEIPWKKHNKVFLLDCVKK